MPRPLWSGSISFGLLNIPVQLMPGERRTDLRFHMMDTRDHARIRFERVNAETGEEVPWKEIVKAYEYKKDSYVVLSPEDLKAAAPESSESVDIEAFVDEASIDSAYFERPYYLVPPKKAEKGYVLLRDTLRETGKAGLARVVIHTREHLALLVPRGPALMLLLLRYPQELIAPDEYRFPEGAPAQYRIAARERDMARQLVESMSETFRPAQYHDEFRARLGKAIEARLKRKGASIEAPTTEDDSEESPKVVDFMAVLKRSLAQRRPPAAASPATSRGRKTKPAAPGSGARKRRRS